MFIMHGGYAILFLRRTSKDLHRSQGYRRVNLDQIEQDPDLPVSVIREIDRLCDEFEQALLANNGPLIENYINSCPVAAQKWLFRELLSMEIDCRSNNGEVVSETHYVDRFPNLRQIVEQAFARRNGDHSPPVDDASATLPDVDTDAVASPSKSKTIKIPQRLGRYRIERQLGAGGFGVVCLAFDETLQRQVAIKVPLPELPPESKQLETFLAEARVLSKLDHPNIVPVYDADQFDQNRCYVVSKFIDGHHLGEVMKQSLLSFHDTATLIATIADALSYAHQQKLVHRDIKPSNILIDHEGKAFLADFGLALTEDEYGQAGAQGGTPAYMSPEQARGEGHLVDGRSDIFSLGIVLYEMLAAERPFTGKSWLDVVDRIARVDARPPRQLNSEIPRELERICLKMLEKRVSDRYATASDVADDIRHFLNARDSTESDSENSHRRTSVVVPKGLRSFDVADAEFFLQLVPGPRDRNGLPDGIRFWKNRIEQKTNVAFRVGLIYGPSGCGKSSLVKAGLLPNLSPAIDFVFLAATQDSTESSLLSEVRRKYDSAAVTLVEVLQHVRRGYDGGTSEACDCNRPVRTMAARRSRSGIERTRGWSAPMRRRESTGSADRA